MATGGSLNKKEIKGRSLNFMIGKKKAVSKNMINTIDFHSLLKFSKLCSTAVGKSITLSDVVPNVCRGNS